jgi:hypothetical protein
MDYQALNTELISDPLTRGYAGMTDEEAATDLNTEYRDVNYPILLDAVNYAIRENGKWTEFRELAELQQISGTYNNQSMREFMDMFTGFTSLPSVDMQAAYMDGLIDDMVTEGSMGPGVAAALKAFGIKTVSRAVEIDLGFVSVGDVEHARTM